MSMLQVNLFSKSLFTKSIVNFLFYVIGNQAANAKRYVTIWISICKFELEFMEVDKLVRVIEISVGFEL